MTDTQITDPAAGTYTAQLYVGNQAVSFNRPSDSTIADLLLLNTAKREAAQKYAEAVKHVAADHGFHAQVLSRYIDSLALDREQLLAEQGEQLMFLFATETSE